LHEMLRRVLWAPPGTRAAWWRNFAVVQSSAREPCL
jgi:hypothetical protein